MGTYLVPELVRMGYKADVVSLDERQSENNVTYIKANAMDDEYLKKLLQNGYDAVVDFMIYSIPQFKNRYPLFMENTNHYIFLSSYRVYADNDRIITENSPRLLDVSDDREFLSTLETEYSLYKAAQENVIRESKYTNYTIVRPAITYSKCRFQLVTLEANVLLYRALNHKRVLLPKDALNVKATMSWAGDVGKMLSRLVLNKAAYKEAYTLATAEHITWGEIAQYYQKWAGLEYEAVDTDIYLDCIAAEHQYNSAKYQLLYDRMFNRAVDNSKILKLTGLKQEELMPLEEGLKKELSGFSLNMITPNTEISERMDMYFKKK